MRRLSLLSAAVAALVLGMTSTASAAGAQLALIPTSKNFGNQLAGTSSGTFTFMLKNKGTATAGTTTPISVTLAGNNPTQFALDASGCPATLAAGAQCAIDTRFTPGPSAMGNQKAQLKVASNPGGGPHADLSGFAQNAHLTISPLASSFGEAVVGQDGSSQIFLVRNDGNLPSGPVTFGTSGGDAGMFVDNGSTCGPSLAKAGDPGDTCTLIYKFHPTAKGNRKTTLSASASPGGTVKSALTGTGTQAHLAVSPPSWNFGSVNLGSTSSSQVFTVTNNGTATTGTLHTSFTGNNPGDFSPAISDTCEGNTLVVGGTCQVELAFTAGGAGNRSAKLVEGESSGPVTVQAGLSGKGVGAKIVLTPANKNFGNVNFGQNASSAAQLFTIKNTGDGTSGSLSGFFDGDAGDFPATDYSPGCLGTLAPGATCTFKVTFTPTASGARASTIHVFAGPGEGTPTATLAGNGTLAALAISPNPDDFGDSYAQPNISNGPHIYTVTNSGTATSGPLDFSSKSGTDPADFVVSDDPAGLPSCDTAGGTTTLAGGASCTFRVEFFATKANPGSEDASIDVATGFAAEGPTALSLTGTGILAKLDVTQDVPGDFGPTETKSFTVTNNGARAASNDIIELHKSSVGGFEDDFVITNDTCTGTHLNGPVPGPPDPGTTCTFDVTWNADSGTGFGDHETVEITAVTGDPNQTGDAALLDGENA